MTERPSKLGLGSGKDFVARIDLDAASERFREALQTEAARAGGALHAPGHQDAQSDGSEVAGAIRWFDASKGYGFIVPDNGTSDEHLGLDRLADVDDASHRLGEGLPAGNWETASVSSFDAASGIGLLSVGSEPSPIYCQIETVRSSGYTELTPGQRVQIKWGHGAKGPTVAAMRPDEDR